MKSNKVETWNGKVLPPRPAHLPPPEVIFAKAREEREAGERLLGEWAKEAAQRGIPMHELIAEKRVEEERVRTKPTEQDRSSESTW